MPDDSFYTSDAAFMAGAPHDQLAYIAANDSDFAKGNPVDQLSYLSHLRGDGPVASPQATRPIPDPNVTEGLGTATGPGIASGSKVPRSIQQAPDWVGNAIAQGTAAGVVGSAVGAVPGVGPLAHQVVRGVGAALPGAIGYAALDYAQKNLPGGKYIPDVAKYIPMFANLGKPGEGPPPSTSRAEGTLAEDIPVAIGKTPMPGPRPNGPYSGPNTPAVMEPLQSGNMAKAGYIPETRTMVTEFNNGKVYQHTGVPKEIYDNFRNAESQGSYFAQNIKGRYTTRYRGSVSPTTSK